jgi:hypothetical protein
MKILSIDIGIKNLAFVILEHINNSSEFVINKWDIICLTNQIPNCYNCSKSAKFSKNQLFYCKKHTKNTEYIIPKINPNKLSKQNIKTLTTIAQEFSLIVDKNINKTNLIELIKEYMNNTCFEVIETINANNVNLIDLGINLKSELNKLFTDIDISTIDLIILENQISPIANRMKTLQGMIAQYFIDCGNYNIEFMSAANKLKPFLENKKTSYAERKKLGIFHTRELLSKKLMDNDILYFDKHNKKDDLADCFLQAIYYLITYNNLNIN